MRWSNWFLTLVLLVALGGCPGAGAASPTDPDPLIGLWAQVDEPNSQIEFTADGQFIIYLVPYMTIDGAPVPDPEPVTIASGPEGWKRLNARQIEVDMLATLGAKGIHSVSIEEDRLTMCYTSSCQEYVRVR